MGDNGGDQRFFSSVAFFSGVACSRRKRADPVSMSVTLSARLGACLKRQAC